MSSSPNNVLTRISWFLTAIGVPAMLCSLSTQHPWLAISVGLLGMIIYLARDVWQKELQNDVIKAVADYIRRAFRSMSHFLGGWKYLNPYYRYLHRVYGSVQVQWTDSEGLTQQRSPELEQIFIEPALASSQDPPNTIQYYLASNRGPLVLLGEVGRGKSTLLQYITLTIIDRSKCLKWKVPYKLPFYLSLGLGVFTDKLKENKNLSLDEALEVAMDKKGWKARSGWVERKLQKGDCLILLDGLDEVSDANTRQQVATWIQRKIISDDNKNSFVITSRIVSYWENPLENVAVLHIQSFNQEQIFTFIDKWYKATLGNLLRAEELKNHLSLKTELFKLVGNPLLLTMAITVHQHRGMLPQSRIALYQEIFEVYLTEHPIHPRKRWRWSIEASHDKSMLPAREKRQEILQTLAYKMMERKILRSIESFDAEDLIKDFFGNFPITPKNFLQNVKHNGILVSSYEFAHRSFQEYLAAMYIKDHQKPELLLSHINDSSWREAIVLYSALADPTPLIEASLKEESLSKHAINLALILLEPEVQRHIDQQAEAKYKVDEAWKRFNRAVSLATEDKDIWREIAKAQLKQRQWKLIPYDETSEEILAKDSSLITCIEYQLFLDQPEYRTRQPDHWQDDRFPKGQGLAPVLGVRPLDAEAFCNWLSTQEQSRAWQYRLPTSEEIQDIFIVRDAGRGYWTKDGNTHQFVWNKEEVLPSNILSSKQLHALSVEDDSLILNDKFKPEEHDYSVSILHARKLTEICSDHERLIEYLDNIHSRISEHESILQHDNNHASKRKEGLEKKLKEVEYREAGYEDTLQEIANRRKRYEEISETSEQIHEAILNKTIKQSNAQLKLQEEQIKQSNAQVLKLREEQIKQLEADLQKSDLGNQLQMQFANEQSIQQVNQLQGRISDHNLAVEQASALLAQLTQEIEHLEQQQKQLEDRKSTLANQLKNDKEREESINQQLEKATSEKNELTQELDIALKEWDKTERKLSSFRTLANEFDRSFSHLGSVQDSDTFGPHKQTLNLDDILLAPRENTWTLENICTAIINSSIQQLTHRLELFHRRSSSDIAFVTIAPYIENALKSVKELAGQFNRVTVDRYVQELDDLLSICLSRLSQNRSDVRNHRSTRRYIRYVAKALAQYLSRADQSMSRHYSDIYITFALLEERIKKNISPSEGILIVRDYIR